MIKGYILPFSTFWAFECERILRDFKNLKITLTPTPREFSSDCGIALYFETHESNTDFFTQPLNSAQIEYDLRILT